MSTGCNVVTTDCTIPPDDLTSTVHNEHVWNSSRQATVLDFAGTGDATVCWSLS